MNTIAGAILVALGIVAFNNYRHGTLGPWFASKFLNQGGRGSTPDVSDISRLWGVPSDPDGGGGGFATGGGAGGGGGGSGAR